MAFIHGVMNMIDFFHLSDEAVIGLFFGFGGLITFAILFIPHIPDIRKWVKNRRYQKDHPEQKKER